MELIVISRPDEVQNEQRWIHALIAAGLETFHVRKPLWSPDDFEKYLKEIPVEIRQNIVIHDCFELALQYELKGVHFPEQLRRDDERWSKIKTLAPHLTVSSSFHDLAELSRAGEYLDYVFLSPVFRSLSKPNYGPGFDPGLIIELLTRLPCKAFALGGVTAERVNQAHELGFQGVAVIGAVWNEADPVGAYLDLREVCQSV